MSQTRGVRKARTRVLVGFFSPNDAPLYLESIGADAEASALAASHAVASAHVRQIGQRLETSVTPLIDDSHVVALRAEPTFAEHAANATGVDLVYVEVAKLVACQPRVDWDHVEALAAEVPQVGDDAGLRRFCLPLQRDAIAPQIQANFNPTTNTFACIVDNPDVRICGPVQGGQNGTGRGFLGFAIGSGLHQMSVVQFNGRYMLNNGYHRAVALARAGHERIPVILTQAPALETTPPARVGMFSPQVVFGASPPRIEDFITPAAVDFDARRTRFLFSVHAEVHPIPG